jgi:hypothetical protein
MVEHLLTGDLRFRRLVRRLMPPANALGILRGRERDVVGLRLSRARGKVDAAIVWHDYLRGLGWL